MGRIEERPSRDEWFIEMALVVSKRSTCQHASQGSVLVDRRGFVVSLGYNGSPSGLRHCEPDSEKGKSRTLCEKHNQCMCIHSELNAIINAARHASLSEELVLYTTSFPCCSCMKAVIQAGVKKIVFVEDYADDFSKKLAEEAGVELVHIPHSKRFEGRKAYEPRI